MTWTAPGWNSASFSRLSGIIEENASDNRIGAMWGITKLLRSVPVASSGDQSRAADTPQAPEGSAPLGGKLIPLARPIIEGLVLCSLWNTLTLGLDLLSVLAVLLSAPPSGDLGHDSYSVLVSDSTAADQEAHSVMKEVMQWALPHRFHWSHMF